MPELPEVQMFINYLNKHIKGLIINDVEIIKDKFLKNESSTSFKKKIIGKEIINIERIGKYLIFCLSGNFFLVSHLRMEGKYFIDNEIRKRKHDYIIYKLSNGKYLTYNDSRQFGTVHLTNNLNDLEVINKIAIDPLSDEFNIDYLYPKIHKLNKNIKAILLDQTIVSGIGNIYASEILYEAKVSPFMSAKDLTKKQIEEIIKYSKLILLEAIKHHGTTIHTFSFGDNETGQFSNYLKVVGRNKQKCLRCKTIIVKEMQQSRGTYYCPKCQK